MAIKTEWNLDTDVLSLLDSTYEKAIKTDAAFSSLVGKKPFDGMADDVQSANNALTGLINQYGKVTDKVKGLEVEQKTLLAVMKELKKQENNFLLNGRYDEYERELQKVRDRMKELGKETEKSGKETEKLGKIQDKLKDKTKSFGDILKNAFALTGILILIDKLVEVGAKIVDITGVGEKYQNQFTRIFGNNSEAAKGYLAILQETADTTNFTFDELADNAAKLASRGITPTRDEILKLGDAANFINKDFEQLNEAILDANEPERWKELGFVVSTAGNQMTLSYGEFTKTVDKSVEGAYSAIQAFAEQGKVIGSTAEAGKTLSGRVSTLVDNFAGIFRTIGNGNKGPLNDFLDLISDILIGTKNLIKFLQPAFDSLGTAFGGLIKAFGSVLNVFGNFSDAGDKMATTSQKIGFYITKYLANPLTGLALIIAGAIEGFSQMFLYLEYATAKLAGNSGLSAIIGKQIDESKARIKDLQDELKKVAAVRDQSLEDYVRKDNQRQRREDRRAREAADAAQSALSAPKPDKPDAVDPKEAERLRKAEYEKLKKAEEDYLKELEKLRTESRKRLLDQFEKDSISYLNAKKDIDLKEIDAEQAKLLELKQLQAGKVGKNSVSGKFEVTPDKSVKLNEEELGLFNGRRNTINSNFEKDINATINKQSQEELELVRQTTDVLIQLEGLKWQKRIDEAKKGTQLYENLIKARDTALAEIATNGKLAQIEQKENQDSLNVFTDLSAKRRSGLISQKDFEEQLQKERNNIALQGAQNRLAILTEFGDKENAQTQDEIRRLKAQILEINNAGQEAQEASLKNRSFYDLLFKATDTKGDADDFGAKAEFYKEVVGGILSFEANAANERVSAIESQIQAKQTQLEKELELQKQGLANNSDLRAAELAQLKEDRKRAVADAKAFQIAQSAIESIEQASSLVTAAANIFKVESKKGVAGLIIAGIGTALLLTLFKIQKQKAADAAKEKTELGEGGTVFGPSHKDGGVRVGNTNLYVEGGEEVVRKRVSERHRKFIKLLNAERIESMNPLDVLKMLNPGWVSAMASSVDKTLDDRADSGSTIPAYFWNAFGEFITSSQEYYSNAPTESAVQVAPGIVKFYGKNGERVVIDRQFVPAPTYKEAIQ